LLSALLNSLGHGFETVIEAFSVVGSSFIDAVQVLNPGTGASFRGRFDRRHDANRHPLRPSDRSRGSDSIAEEHLAAPWRRWRA
jgi:hypothetical protein